MNLINLLPLENVIIDLAADSRREILNHLISPLLASQVVTNATLFVDDLEEREDQVTTQVESGVALPHARSLAVRRLGLTIGLAREPGLVFGPDPNNPCRLFFMIAIPEFAPAAHLPLLKILAALAHDPERRDRLMNCKTAKQVVKQINQFKG